MRRTKILATLGPATADPAALRSLVDAGANGFRINFSHGDTPGHRRAIRDVRTLGRRLRRHLFVVADLQGPKLRLGDLGASPVALRPGSAWVLDDRPEPGDDRRARAEVPDLRGSARPGDPILVGDGNVELRVESVGPASVTTVVVSGGPVSSRAGLYLPRARLRPHLFDAKDRTDLAVAVAEGVDYVALSFVARAADVRDARNRGRRLSNGAEPGWIAKIERAEAVERFDEILAESDAIMVARGDLGIEVPLQRLALVQKDLVARARAAGVPSIVATQMLLSMVHAPRPTRAEATDVANAVLDGTDCVMLSEETAVGEHPAEAVRWLDRIARATEPARAYRPVLPRPDRGADPVGASERAVAEAALRIADDTRAGLIVTPTHSGRTARWVAAGRPRTPVVALSSHPETLRRLELVWGVRPHGVPDHLDLLALRRFAERTLGRIAGVGGRPIVLTAGYPLEGRPTNLVTVVEPGGSEAPPPRSRSARGRRTGGVRSRPTARR